MTTTLINCRQLKLENQTWSKQSARELHCESKQLKPTKNKLTWCDFTTFSEQVFANSLDLRFRSFYALHIQNLLNCCQPKQNQSVSRILWISFFGGFLLFGWTVRELGCPSPDLTKKKHTRQQGCSSSQLQATGVDYTMDEKFQNQCNQKAKLFHVCSMYLIQCASCSGYRLSHRSCP